MTKDGPKRHSPQAGSATSGSPFSRSWEALLTTTVHLDSLLYKLSPRDKSRLARILPVILMRPHAISETAGIELRKGEPWSLDAERMARWPGAERLFRWLDDRVREGAAIESLALPASEHDFPPRMIDELGRSWGETAAAELAATLASPAPMSLRVSHRSSPEELIRMLDPERLPVRVARGDLAPGSVSLSGYAQVLNTDAFRDGLFEIQDEGSQVMAHFALRPESFAPLLQERPGHAAWPAGGPPQPLPSLPSSLRVVDACAGAGGKSLAFADALRGGGRVFAYDTVAGKLQALKKRATRAQYRNIQTVVVPERLEASAELMGGKFRESADRVLVDAPCSGWGVLRRNPDIKWRQGADEPERLAALQLRLLGTYQSLVARNGILTFGVCTFRKAETLDVVQAFNQAHGDRFEPVAGGYLGPGPCDGFFMHAWRRKA